MNAKVVAQTLRVGRVGLVWYVVGTLLVVATGGLGLSSVQSSGAALESLFQSLPPALLEVFKINLSSFTSTVGYVSARSLSLLWPLLMIAFVAGSAGGVTQMLERGTIHFELSLPVSRTRWFLSRVLAGSLGVLLIVLVTWLALNAFAAATWWRFLPFGATFGMLWLGVAYAVAAFARDRGVVTGVVFGFFATQFVLATLAGVVDGAQWLEGWNLWSAYRPEAVINGDLPWGTMALWTALGIALVALGAWRWRTRDIPA
jgi:ABC-type transport system involved in multi-copper enzyme maturation permease subunit